MQNNINTLINQYLMKYLVLIILLIFNFAYSATLVGKASGQNTDKGDFRIVFPLSQKTEFSSFRLENPPRLVIDIPAAQLRDKVSAIPIQTKNITGVRLGTQQGTDLRIVVDMKSIRPASIALMQKGSAYELVILMSGDASHQAQSSMTYAQGQSVVTQREEVKIAKTVPKKRVLIIIDPGHGGKDPGAVGGAGTREKDIVLAISKKLRDKINQEPGMSAMMTRDNDRFIPLRERVLIARRHKADMFVSIHADAGSRTADGASLYILSTSGASSEAARMLATSENMSDLIGGVKISNKDDALASMLLDISQDATIEASNTLGVHLLNHLRKHANLHKKTVERAGFAVLKAPDIPSVLVETGFISNPNEERKLKTSLHQTQLAEDILLGIKSYYKERPATELVYTTIAPIQTVAKVLSNSSAPNQGEVKFPNIELRSRTETHKTSSSLKLVSTSTLPAVKKYTTTRGDTLHGIAIQFNLSVEALKRRNNLPDNQIRVPSGTILTLP